MTTTHYLVKWRSLPYEDCTWELEADVDPLKIKEFSPSTLQRLANNKLGGEKYQIKGKETQ